MSRVINHIPAMGFSPWLKFSKKKALAY